MELDHLFVFTEPGGGSLRGELAALGLKETYERSHPGQGTANVCYVFDNAFLELLWLTDADEARSPAIQRTRLYERSDWRTTGTCRFGIAYRTEAEAPFPTWPYRPPYLPIGMDIPVAVCSDDPGRPMIFRSPGRIAPSEWGPERQRGLQRSAGFRRLGIALAAPAPAHSDLFVLQEAGVLTLNTPAPSWAVSLELHRHRERSVGFRIDGAR